MTILSRESLDLIKICLDNKEEELVDKIDEGLGLAEDVSPHVELHRQLMMAKTELILLFHQQPKREFANENITH